MDPEESRRKYAHASKLFESRRYSDAFREYLELAESGSVTAQVFLGWLYYRGQGVAQDTVAAQKWLKRAADSGSAIALYYLGGLYRGRKEYRLALENLEKAAGQNYTPALYHLSIMHEEGEGVPIDRAKAQYYREKAAGMGHLRAQIEIGRSLMIGQGGVQHIPKGVWLFVRALAAALRVGWSDPDSEKIRW